MTGAILKADGSPAAGAVVRRSRDFRRRPTPFEGHEYPSSVTADEQGRLAMPGIPCRGCTLVAVSADDTEAAALRCLPMEQHEVEFRLAPPGSVVGVAYDADGEPVVDMKVYLSGGSVDLVPPGVPFKISSSMKTDEKGRYRFEGLVAGLEYHIGYVQPGTNIHERSASFTAEGGDMPHVVDIYLEE